MSLSPRRPTVLVVDNYDSFVHTLVGYLTELGAAVTFVEADAVSDARALIAGFDGVMISPGPGTPAEASGSIAVLQAAAEAAMPLLGVCLGHQVLALAAGAEVVLAPEPMHGRASHITHDSTGLFVGLESNLNVGRYHSLTIDPRSLPPTLAVTATADDGTIMAIRHRELPMQGVQFHPESVLTDAGYAMIANWLTELGMTDAAAHVPGLRARGNYSAAQ